MLIVTQYKKSNVRIEDGQDNIKKTYTIYSNHNIPKTKHVRFLHQ